MVINGEIRQFYADREKTKPIYPRVSSNAVVFESGNSRKRVSNGKNLCAAHQGRADGTGGCAYAVARESKTAVRAGEVKYDGY